MQSGFEKYLDTYPDFPKKGILYYDISRLLSEAWAHTLAELSKELRVFDFECDFELTFAGIESRGFLLAGALASDSSDYSLKMIRKKGKLPGKTVEQAITLEYGEAILECHPGKGNVILCDDVVATGGTMRGAEELLTKAGYNVVAKCCLLNLKHLNDLDVVSLIEKNE